MQLETQALAQGLMDALPRPIKPPAAKIAIHGLPSRPLLRQEAPRAPRAQDVKDGVEDRAPRVDARATGGRFWGQHRLEQRPFGVGEIGSVKEERGIHALP